MFIRRPGAFPALATLSLKGHQMNAETRDLPQSEAPLAAQVARNTDTLPSGLEFGPLLPSQEEVAGIFRHYLAKFRVLEIGQ